MIAQRVGVSALRQVATKSSNAAFFSHNLPRLALGIKANANMQIRPVTTSKLTESDAQSLLAAQRKQRPTSPHLSIYDYSQTWFIGSIWTRITGGLFSGGLYVFATAYLAAPLLGWHLESASLAAAFGALPVVAKGGLKFLLAWPFSFHVFNGVRHLIWDTGKGFAKSGLISTGWTLWGASLATALGLAFWL